MGGIKVTPAGRTRRAHKNHKTNHKLIELKTSKIRELIELKITKLILTNLAETHANQPQLETEIKIIKPH